MVETAFGFSSLGRFWGRGLCSLFTQGKEWLPEGLLKIVATLKVDPTVFLGFGEQPDIDHVKNNLSEILAVVHTPLLKNGQSHWSELLERIIPYAFNQFLSRNVPYTSAGVPANAFLGEIKCLTYK